MQAKSQGHCHMWRRRTQNGDIASAFYLLEMSNPVTLERVIGSGPDFKGMYAILQRSAPSACTRCLRTQIIDALMQRIKKAKAAYSFNAACQ